MRVRQRMREWEVEVTSFCRDAYRVECRVEVEEGAECSRPRVEILFAPRSCEHFLSIISFHHVI